MKFATSAMRNNMATSCLLGWSCDGSAQLPLRDSFEGTTSTSCPITGFVKVKSQYAAYNRHYSKLQYSKSSHGSQTLFGVGEPESTKRKCHGTAGASKLQQYFNYFPSAEVQTCPMHHTPGHESQPFFAHKIQPGSTLESDKKDPWCASQHLWMWMSLLNRANLLREPAARKDQEERRSLNRQHAFEFFALFV